MLFSQKISDRTVNNKYLAS